MFDFSKLNGKPWCSCCDNDQIVRAAEEVIDNVVQKHYTKPMCVGSLQMVVEVAAMMMAQVIGGITAQKTLDRNPVARLVPFSVMRATAIDFTHRQMEEINEQLAGFFNEHDKSGKWEEQLLQKMHAAQELAKADEAFAKDAKGD